MPDRPSNSIPITSPGRSLFKWLLTALLGLAGACLIILFLTAGYLYQNPSSLKELVSGRLSGLIGATVTIRELSCGVNPLRLSARDIAVTPTQEDNGLALHLGLLDIDARITGPFGHRTLVVDRLRANDFAVALRTDARLLSAVLQDASPSLLSRLLRRLIAIFLASELEWVSLMAEGGRLTVTGSATQLVFDDLDITYSPDKGGAVYGQLRESRIGAFTRLAAAVCRLHLYPAGYTQNGSMAARADLSGGSISRAPFALNDISAAINLIFVPELNDIKLPEITLKGNLAGPVATPVSASTASRLTVKGCGLYHASQKVIELAGWSVTAPGLVEASGTARIEARPPFQSRLKFANGRVDTDGLGLWYGALGAKKPQTVKVSGPVRVRGGVDGPLSGKLSDWRGNLQLSLQDIALAAENAAVRLQAALSGSIEATGHLAAPHLQMAVAAREVGIAVGDAAVTGWHPSVTAYGHFPVLNLTMSTTRSGAGLTMGPRRLTQVMVALDQGRVNLRSGELALPRITLSSATIKNLAGMLTRVENRIVLALRGRDTGLMETAAAWGLLPDDWHFDARDTLELRLDWETDGPGLLQSRLELTDMRFSDATGSRLAENVVVAAETSTRLSHDKNFLPSELRLSAAAGEVLWGKHYIDFGATPLSAAGSVQLHADSRRLTFERLAASLVDLIECQVTGTLKAADEDLDFDGVIEVPPANARPLYRHLIAEPYRYENPHLTEVQVGGQIGAEIEVSRSAGTISVKGRAHWRQGLVNHRQWGVSVSGIDLDLPLWYQSTAAEQIHSPLKGHLKTEKTRLPYLGNVPLRLAFDVGPNRLTIGEPPALPLKSGRIDIGPVSVENLYQPGLKLKTRASLAGVEIDDLLKRLWPQPVGGTLSGRLLSVFYKNGRLGSRGTLTADIFGGSVQILDPGLSGIATSVPVLTFDSRINDLNLEKMTSGTDFGKIRGVLQGRIDNVEIVNGQPQRFDLRLETIEKKGLKQEINVRAIENIARLGGGASPFMGLAGSLAAIFKQFPYEKIGVAASLQNDAFRINGTIKDDDKEYLVKRSGVSGVDVVNLNPDNQISFKDMVKRIKRISSSGDGPVIR